MPINLNCTILISLSDPLWNIQFVLFVNIPCQMWLCSWWNLDYKAERPRLICNFGLPSSVPGCGVTISVMQQYLTAWTQALDFTQEAEVWVSHWILCQLGCSSSQTCCTINNSPPIDLCEWAAPVDPNSFKHQDGRNFFLNIKVCLYFLNIFLHFWIG